jgi:hypothetical protein
MTLFVGSLGETDYDGVVPSKDRCRDWRRQTGRIEDATKEQSVGGTFTNFLSFPFLEALWSGLYDRPK